MRDSPTSENWGDFSQRYKDTYGFLLGESAKKVLVRVDNVSEDSVRFVDDSGHEYFARVDAGVQFEFIPVDMGAYNVRKGVLLVNRQPARQWKRGICRNNTSIRQVQIYNHSKGVVVDFVAQKLDFNLLSEIVWKPYPVDKAIDEFFVSKSRDDLALEKRFVFSKSGVVLLHDVKVGDFKDFSDKFTITVSNIEPIVQQEVYDACRRNGIALTMEVSDANTSTSKEKDKESE